MKSSITSKFQTTIPKDIRENLKLSINDALEWKIENGKAVVTPLKAPFLKYRNSIKVGAGEITQDIKDARQFRIKKYK